LKAKTLADPKMCKEGDKLTCWVLESKKHIKDEE